MEPIRQSAESFLKNPDTTPIADVRTPLEYEKGHIPGAYLFPLFSNEERAEVGKLYALKGSAKAIEKGYELAGPKLKDYLNEATRLAPHRELSIYCWRGGMRSASLAWLLGFSGFRINLLEGGYKAYRKFTHSILGHQSKIILLGGYTGSGKTEILNYLKEKGEQVLNLEELSQHKGSAFGWIGENNQPDQEQFENDLAEQWRKFDFTKTIWLEDESINIGRIQIPRELFMRMESAPVLVMETEQKERIERLVRDYKAASSEELKTVFNRISKRIGQQNCRQALLALEKNDMQTAASIALAYYDKAYDGKLRMRDKKNLYNIKYNPDTEKLLDALLEMSKRA